MKLKLHDKMEILINNEVLTGEIDGISTRETDLEFWEYYSIKLNQKGWSISLSHCTEKDDEPDDKNELWADVYTDDSRTKVKRMSLAELAKMKE